MTRLLAAGRCALAVLIMAVGLAGCSAIDEALFGKTETPAQQAYLDKAKYIWVAIPARNYVQASDAKRGVVQAVCSIDQAFFDASQGAAAAALGGGDEITRVLFAISSGLASLSLEVFGQAVLPRPGEIVERGAILTRVGALSVGEMRIWRKQFVEVKTADFVANARDPSADEWAQLDSRLAEIHEAIQVACSQEESAASAAFS